MVWDYPENSAAAVGVYDYLREDENSSEESTSSGSGEGVITDPVEINKRLIDELKEGMDSRDPHWLYIILGAIRLFEKDGIEISQPVWQLAYMCIVYCIENKAFLKSEIAVGHSNPQEFKNVMQQVRIQILAKLKPTIAAKKITKFIRSAADRIKAAKIIQSHYKEYLYRPDVYLKSEISKPARTRFQSSLVVGSASKSSRPKRSRSRMGILSRKLAP
jgi:hypothetical protein